MRDHFLQCVVSVQLVDVVGWSLQFKQKKARDKYGDQDEEDRELMMEFLAVRVLGPGLGLEGETVNRQ